jgi:hypothetical protein
VKFFSPTPHIMNNVVARFLDGRVLKGSCMDVQLDKPAIHLRIPGGKNEAVELKQLKALFFVRSLEGDAARDDAKQAASDDPRLRGSAPIVVHFADNESISGLTNRYPPNKPFFFILPVDATSNNIRILVNRDAVVRMESAGGSA